jgi:hypothetical protein
VRVCGWWSPWESPPVGGGVPVIFFPLLFLMIIHSIYCLRWLLHPGGQVSCWLPRSDSASPPSRRHYQRLGLARGGGCINAVLNIGVFPAFLHPPLPVMLRFLDRTRSILPVYQLLVFNATPACVLVQSNRGLQLQSYR